MAMSPRKKMAMGKDGDKKMKPAVKLRAGGAVKKAKSKAPENSPRPAPNPRRRGYGEGGNRESELEGQDYNDVLANGGRGRRRMRMGGMVKK